MGTTYYGLRQLGAHGVSFRPNFWASKASAPGVGCLCSLKGRSWKRARSLCDGGSIVGHRAPIICKSREKMLLQGAASAGRGNSATSDARPAIGLDYLLMMGSWRTIARDNSFSAFRAVLFAWRWWRRLRGPIPLGQSTMQMTSPATRQLRTCSGFANMLTKAAPLQGPFLKSPEDVGDARDKPQQRVVRFQPSPRNWVLPGPSLHGRHVRVLALDPIRRAPRAIARALLHD